MAEEKVKVRIGEELVTLTVPKGTTDEEIKAFVARMRGPSREPPEAVARSGPLGIVSPEARLARQERLAERTGFERFAADALPATIGTVVGGALGGPIGAGVLGGAGELVSQELGSSPRSNLALGAAGLSPLVGAGAGKIAQATGRGTVALARQSPVIRSALATVEATEGQRKLVETGAEILAKQKGLMNVGSGRLRKMINRLGQKLSQRDLRSTLSSLEEMSSEIFRRGLAEMPHGQQALSSIQSVRNALTERLSPQAAKALGQEIKPVSFDQYLSIRSEVGQAVAALEKQAGVRLGSAKKLFASMANDLDRVVKTAKGSKRTAAHLSKRFLERAKLEFTVKDLDDMIAKSVVPMKGGGTDQIVNASALFRQFRLKTNPKSFDFDKNFVDALGPEAAEIEKTLARLNEIVQVGPGGFGSIVVRGRLARAGEMAVGGLAGAVTGGLVGPGGLVGGLMAGAGAVAGAGLPELLNKGLLTATGRKALERFLLLGRGELNSRTITAMSQVINKAFMSAGRTATDLINENVEEDKGPMSLRERLKRLQASPLP